jgi:hypothetical protein
MKNFIFLTILGLGLLWATSCKKEGNPIEAVSFDFAKQQHNWVAGFADYSDVYGDMELNAEMAPLPDALNPSGKTTGFKVQGNNRSDDLFMFIKRKMTGLLPNRTYAVQATIQLASDARPGAIGIGGAPGENVYLKAGVLATEPTVSKNTLGYYDINIDKGNQAVGGKDMKVIGNIAKDDDKPDYASIVRKADGMTVKTSNQGECWIIIGTDSGFEGLTRLFYQKIDVELVEVK